MITFYDRAGCHLCEQAWPVVAEVAAAEGVPVRRVDVDGDVELARRYGDFVPVVLVGEEVVAYWRVGEDALRAAVRSRRGGPAAPGWR